MDGASLLTVFFSLLRKDLMLLEKVVFPLFYPLYHNSQWKDLKPFR